MGNIKGVSKINEADYYVIMDGAPSKLVESLDRSRVIFFQREPSLVVSPFSDDPLADSRSALNHDFLSNILFDGSYKNFHNVGIWWIDKSFNELEKLPYPPKNKKFSFYGKTGNNLSSVTSGKTWYPAHTTRIDFLNQFIEEYSSLDVWGRGTGKVLKNTSCYKGEIPTPKCKFKGLIDYEYSLTLENTFEPNTWTEKPLDAFLCWSIPIYSGASNFGDFFPSDSFLQIDITSEQKIKKTIPEIIEYISSPVSAKQIEALREARNDLLFKWNIWPIIDRIIKEK